jgi:hypothetical protein
VFFSLLKGHLFSDGIGLISHWFLWSLMGIYGRSRGSDEFRRFFVLADLAGVLMRALEVVGMFLLCFFWDSDGVPVECPSGIAYGISLVGFLC